MKSSFFRKILSKQFWRRALFLFVALVTCIAAAYHIETFRSKRAWEDYKKDAQRRGIEFDPAGFNKPAIPDDQNYAANPYLMGDDEESDQMLQGLATIVQTNDNNSNLSKGNRFSLDSIFKQMQQKQMIHDGNGQPADQILTVLREVPALECLRQASARPECRFTFDYGEGYNMDAQHIVRLGNAAEFFAYSAHAAIAKEDAVLAVEECRQLFRIAKALKSETYYLALVVRVGVLSRAIQVFHDGLLAGIWSEEHLHFFVDQWSKQMVIEHLRDCAKSERAFFCSYMEALAQGDTNDLAFVGQRVRQMCPSGWYYRNALVKAQMYERWEEHFHSIDETVSPGLLGSSFDQIFDQMPKKTRWNQLIYQESGGSEMIETLAKSFLMAINNIRAARLACVFELDLRKNGKYPDSLESLVGDAAYACDVSDGIMFGYQLTTDGYELRSSDGKTLWKIKRTLSP